MGYPSSGQQCLIAKGTPFITLAYCTYCFGLYKTCLPYKLKYKEILMFIAHVCILWMRGVVCAIRACAPSMTNVVRGVSLSLEIIGAMTVISVLGYLAIRINLVDHTVGNYVDPEERIQTSPDGQRVLRHFH
jgi:hypothetical protein